jgi:CPA2 family monovalent cation:H+ antiporter-2
VSACGLIFFLVKAIRNRNLFQLPFIREMQRDHELQVFTGACICFGFALLGSYAGLTAPVGAFAAGLYIGRSTAFGWLETTLQPFRVFFTALFFVALGLMVDIPFVAANAGEITVVTLLILVVNSLLSAVVFRALGSPWKSSLPAGALLSQTGEFSLIACTLAYKAQLIDSGQLKGPICVIVLTLLLSTPWAQGFRMFFQGPDHLLEAGYTGPKKAR